METIFSIYIEAVKAKDVLAEWFPTQSSVWEISIKTE